jgi:hypothetical protein
MSRRKRVLVSFGIVAAACVTYLWFFGIQTVFVLEAHNAARKVPFLKRTPVRLTDSSISQAPGMKLSYFGYEFEIPWTDIDNEKIRIAGGNKVIIPFRSGNVLMVWSAPPHEFMNGVLTQLKIDRETFRKIYGEGVLDSDYTFQRFLLETTPNQIALSATKERDASQMVLLLVKAISIPGDPESGIFDVRGKEFKGFQYGSPQSPSRHLNVELFPEEGHIDLFFAQNKAGSTLISQADINRVVKTFHAVSAEPSVRDEGLMSGPN